MDMLFLIRCPGPRDLDHETKVKPERFIADGAANKRMYRQHHLWPDSPRKDLDPDVAALGSLSPQQVNAVLRLRLPDLGEPCSAHHLTRWALR
ncbi:hypothetical protein I546_3377 [Mycobacterium kansasii 732]|uniref:hypothetical protein n=1 Tax=Mycobacterium pseudokansasii TaxID=2341080 RepID=UPI000448880B|nr:hypothetical protein [Mycobacterium pseudokansasii]EUA10499.1 hypothetical protein I546_3377 [Mycobacterium kansasii 732]MBY0386714.1 hypothetical protein [Mycobacterium pseudokansasii]